MERREPTLEKDVSPRAAQDWGNLRFGRRSLRTDGGSPDDNADARFWIGLLVFLAVAAAYPWYSYWVNARLLARDLQRAGEEIGRQLEASNAEFDRQSAAMKARNAEVARQVQLRSVRVIGVLPRPTGAIAIVDLGAARLSEAAPVICRQAGAMMGRSLSGEALRVQRGRGRQPAVDIGNIRC